MRYPLIAMLLAGLCGACGGAGADDPSRDARPDGILPLRSAVAPVSTGEAGPARLVRFHGGSMLRGSARIYLLWYGRWGGEGARRIIPDLVRGLSGSSYLGIHGTYRHFTGVPATQLELAGEAEDPGSFGLSLGDGQVEEVVVGAVDSGALPLDSGGIYVVLAASDVVQTSGLCRSYCGYHDRFHALGRDLKIAFVGHPGRCLDACAPQTMGPNGDGAADAMASLVAHEVSETITDPDLDGWYDPEGAESGDKCSWTFGAEYRAANGARANIRLGHRDFLLQQLWVNHRDGYCGTAAP